MATAIEAIKKGNGYGGSIVLLTAIQHPELSANKHMCAALARNMTAGGIRLCQMSLKDKVVILTLLRERRGKVPFLAQRMLMAWRPCNHRERFAYAEGFVKAVMVSMDRRRENGWTSLPEEVVHIVIMLGLS